MSLSPAIRTTKPLADIVSVFADQDRLVILDVRTPLNSDRQELRHIINAGTRVVQKGGFLAFHASRDSLNGRSQFARALADQIWRVSSAVANARGRHEHQVQVYHRPQVFAPPLERGLGWDIVVVSRSRKPRTEAVRGILMQRYGYVDVLDGIIRGISIPETDPARAVYTKMFRSVTSVRTKCFPAATSWQDADGIAEIDLNDTPSYP